MTCRQCEGKLKVSSDADQVICQHCETEYLVSFNEGAISVKLLSEGLKKIQVSTDKTASELALVRIMEEKKRIADTLGDDIIEIKDAEFYLSENGKALLKSINWEHPEKSLSAFRQRLENEKKLTFLFSNKEVINDMETLIKIISDLPKYQKLLAQEKYHREIVNKL